MAPKDLIDFPYHLVFEKPQRLTDIKSWHGHIPFAFFLVQAIRPRVFVELGVHKGDSYCAFCQAVRNLSIDCRCYAVDSWRGDRQSGFYDEEIIKDLKPFHDNRFASFSKLIRSTFDNALARFSDSSIDLLHIDGFHEYQAVKHDFESWLPKMSQRGVILVHDTNERQGDFGVWKLWEEHSGRYDSFEFFHSHGLGVLFVGVEMPEELAPLFLCSDRDRRIIRKFFSGLGDNILLEGRITELNRAVANLSDMAKQHHRMIEIRDRQIESLKARVGELEKKSEDHIS